MKSDNNSSKNRNEYSSLTKALRERVDIKDANPSVTPLFQNSAFESDSPYFYTRKANPNSLEFENVIKILEQANHAIAVTTGMTAISLALNLLKIGQTLVINKDIYGCSYKLFQRVAQQKHLNLIILDLSLRDNLEKIPLDTNMIFFETPTNPFLKTITINEVSKTAKGHNPQCLIVVDNTWGTPLFQKPLGLGADISLYSATKYFSGHSDVMGGVLVTNNEDLAQTLRDERFYQGAILDPHSAWLLRRSLQTLSLRMKEHEKITKELKDFVSEFSCVKKVYYPQIDGTQLSGYGGIIFFEFDDDHKDQYSQFMNSLSLFGTGTAMACVTSMVAQPYFGSHASMNEDEKKQMNIGPELVRLCFGLESIEDIKQDLTQAFEKVVKNKE